MLRAAESAQWITPERPSVRKLSSISEAHWENEIRQRALSRLSRLISPIKKGKGARMCSFDLPGKPGLESSKIEKGRVGAKGVEQER